MMNRLHVAVVSAAIAVSVAHGAVRTFTGTSNGNWNNTANWADGNLPTDGDYVIDSSSQASRNNNIGALSLSGLEFTGTWNGSATFGGSPITLLEGAAVTNATGCRLLCDVQFVLASGMHDFHISGSGNPRIDIRAVMSGTGGVRRTGNGLLAVSSANTFTGGFSMAGEGSTYYTGASAALGAASGPITFEKGAQLYLYANGLDIPNPVTFYGETGSSGNVFVMYPATFSGTVTLASDGCTHIKSLGGAAAGILRFAGDVVYDGTGTGLTSSFGGSLDYAVHFDKRLNWPNGTYRQDNTLTTCFNAESNVFASLDIRAGDVRFAKDAISGANDLLVTSGGTIHFIFDGDNTFRRLATEDDGLSGDHSVTSSVPSTLTVLGTQDDTFAGSVDGEITIDWRPVSAQTLKFTRGGNTTGGLKAAGGALVLDSASFPNISSVELSSGATLTLQYGASINTRLDTLAVPSGAAISGVSDTQFRVDHYFLDGVEMQDGATYDLGNGNSVYVVLRPGPGTKYVWDGGGADNTSFDLAANWSGDATPIFGPKVIASFEGGTAATLAARTELNGFEFNLAGDFMVDGAYAVDLYWGGITLPVVFSGYTATIATPLSVAGDQAWNVADGATLAVTGAISAGTDPAPVVKNGAGTLVLAATNSMTGDLIISNGMVSVMHDEALGASSSGAAYLLRNSTTALPASLSFGTCRISRDIHLEGPDNNYYPMCNTADSTNLFTGRIYIDDSAIKRIRSADRAVMTFAGGVESPNAMFYMQGRGKYMFTTTPINVKNIYSDTIADISMSAAGNVVGAMALYKDSVFRVETDNVFAAAPELELAQGAVVEMNGHDMTLNNLKGDSVAYIRSNDDALLAVTQNSGGNSYAVFEGAVSLSKQGGKTLSLCSVSTSAGSLSVDGGLMNITSTGGWKGAKVTVGNGGILRLYDGTELAGRKCVLTVQGSGKIGLNPGADIRVGRLVVNGVRMPNGTYGSSKSNAANKNDSLFESRAAEDCPGILRVVGMPPGMTIGFH